LLTISPFPATPLSLGLLCDFVAKFPPFDGFEFQLMTVTLRHQLEARCNLVAGHNDEIVGYLGWIRTTNEIADAWMKDQGPLTAATQDASAIAFTIMVATDRRYVLPLIRQAKRENPGVSAYWKRQFADKAAAAKRSVTKRSE
jgi:hypothetical protein